MKDKTKVKDSEDDERIGGEREGAQAAAVPLN